MDRQALQERFGIVGTSAALRHVIDQVRLVSRTDVSVLIQGESGVGKELIAEAIHALSKRRHQHLITVNCGAIPEGLIESELFGNEKGAYTGAVERRTGYFEDADKGTILLDEIGEMPLAAQVRLLRVLETGEFSRVGSSVVRKSDVRIIAATNKDLGKEVQEGKFREDLYYRLSTVIIKIPPIRERKEDIIPLFDNFLHHFSQKYDSGRKVINEEARALLVQYRWPGNVRELRNVAERCVVLYREQTITAAGLRPYLRGITASGNAMGLVHVRQGHKNEEGTRERELIYRALLELRLDVREMKEQLSLMNSNAKRDFPVSTALVSQSGSGYMPVPEDERPLGSAYEDVSYEIELDEPGFENGSKNFETNTESISHDGLSTLAEAERKLITKALQKHEGNRRQTAKALGISERTLYRKIKEFEDEDASS